MKTSLPGRRVPPSAAHSGEGARPAKRRALFTYININRHVVARNRKTGERQPPIRITTGIYGRPRYASAVEIQGSVTVQYTPDWPLACGASAYLVCGGKVKVLR